MTLMAELSCTFAKSVNTNMEINSNTVWTIISVVQLKALGCDISSGLSLNLELRHTPLFRPSLCTDISWEVS